LPHPLVAAFRATLEEVAAADLLLHVIDASSPDRERHMDAVRAVLREVGADRVKAIDVFNKCDQLDEGERARLGAIYPGALCVSARTGEGRDDLVMAMEGRLALDTARVTLQFDEPEGADRERISQLYRLGRIFRHVASDGRVTIEVEMPRRVLERYQAERVAAV
jgi:GTP-binding protein HflX